MTLAVVKVTFLLKFSRELSQKRDLYKTILGLPSRQGVLGYGNAQPLPSPWMGGERLRIVLCGRSGMFFTSGGILPFRGGEEQHTLPMAKQEKDS